MSIANKHRKQGSRTWTGVHLGVHPRSKQGCRTEERRREGERGKGLPMRLTPRPVHERKKHIESMAKVFHLIGGIEAEPHTAGGLWICTQVKAPLKGRLERSSLLLASDPMHARRSPSSLP